MRRRRVKVIDERPRARPDEARCPKIAARSDAWSDVDSSLVCVLAAGHEGEHRMEWKFTERPPSLFTVPDVKDDDVF